MSPMLSFGILLGSRLWFVVQFKGMSSCDFYPRIVLSKNRSGRRKSHYKLRRKADFLIFLEYIWMLAIYQKVIDSALGCPVTDSTIFSEKLPRISPLKVTFTFWLPPEGMRPCSRFREKQRPREVSGNDSWKGASISSLLCSVTWKVEETRSLIRYSSFTYMSPLCWFYFIFKRFSLPLLLCCL